MTQWASDIAALRPGSIPGETWRRATGWTSHLGEDFEVNLRGWSARLDGYPDRVVLLGMGGSSAGVGLYAEVLGRERVTILDTSFPDDIVTETFDDCVVVASSKSGTTVETICGLAWALAHGLTAERLVIITDPGTPLEELGRSLGANVFLGDAQTGGRFSAFSAFGLVPLLLMGVSVDDILAWEKPDVTFIELAVSDGLASAALTSSGDGTYVLCSDPLLSFTALWEEQLVAESTGKNGRGFTPVAGPPTPLPSEPLLFIAQRFWWTVGAAAGLGVDPFDQPNVELAKRNVFAILDAGEKAGALPMSVVTPLPANVTLQVFGPLACAADLAAWRSSVVGSGLQRVTAGLGPRFLHSSGQLHKGGPNDATAYIQVVVEPSTEPERIPGRKFSFHDLYRAQADADAAALTAAGRVLHRVWLPVGAPLESITLP